MNKTEMNTSEIKELLGKDISELISHLTDGKPAVTLSDFYSGKVEDNNDPEQLGRCRIRVYGVHSSEIPTSDLPWSTPDMQFIGSKVGSFIVPPIDAIIQVYFDKGDLYNPKYTTKVLTGNLPNDIEEDYPNTMVFFETDNGESFKINRKSGTTIYRHSSGTMFTINENGDIEIATTPSTSGNLTINVKGDVEILSDTIQMGATGFTSTVTPDATGGPMNCLPVCPFGGAIHQGKICTHCNPTAGLEAS